MQQNIFEKRFFTEIVQFGVTQFIGSFSKPNSLGLVDGKILQFAKANKFGIRLWSDPIHWVFFQTQFIGFGGWQNLTIR